MEASENALREGHGFQRLGDLIPTSSPTPVRSGFRMSGWVVRPSSFATIGTLRPGRTPPSSIGRRLTASGCARPPTTRQPVEIAYIDGATTWLARLRKQWTTTAPKPTDGEFECYRDEVFDIACILAHCLEAPGEARLARRVSATRAHGYLPDIDTDDTAIVVADWVWAFSEVPLWATDYAIKLALEWKRRITIADVREALPTSALRRAADELVRIVNSEIWRSPPCGR